GHHATVANGARIIETIRVAPSAGSNIRQCRDFRLTSARTAPLDRRPMCFGPGRDHRRGEASRGGMLRIVRPFMG
ncbi:hypothetical protein, partial [Brucella anthropi]|uniref:hypothetical protein n=1 Tax=Brucella anthropi TaxID=529 RepID=UPI001AED8549